MSGHVWPCVRLGLHALSGAGVLLAAIQEVDEQAGVQKTGKWFSKGSRGLCKFITSAATAASSKPGLQASNCFSWLFLHLFTLNSTLHCLIHSQTHRQAQLSTCIRASRLDSAVRTMASANSTRMRLPAIGSRYFSSRFSAWDGLPLGCLPAAFLSPEGLPLSATSTVN